jgi:signal transduction histidine kinase
VSVLGEHLISDQAVGLIELVKNAYDADATEVLIELLGLTHADTTTVIVRDNGTGMTIDDIADKWLSPAVDHKERAKQQRQRTKLGRLPIGEKGVGRFAVHQIGRALELVTRVAGGREIFFKINWDDFESGEKFLDSVDLTVQEREPEVFTADSTGTLIKIGRARCQWTRPLLEKVHRTLRRLQSPLRQDERTKFNLIVTCPDYPEFENIDLTDILDKAHYEFRALVDAEGRCDFEYRCSHPAVPPRGKSDTADLVPLAGEELHGTPPACGPFWINLYVWDRTKDYLAQSQVSTKELNAQCGVSLFRDDLRVLPYGDPGNDWLLLDQERIQDPSGKIGNNQVIGVIQVLQESNLQLRDTTNRQGLIENEAFNDLRALSRAAIRLFTTYWKKDRPPARDSVRKGQGSLEVARGVASGLKETAREDVQVEVPTPAEEAEEGEVIEGPSEGKTRVSQRKAVEMLIENLDGAARTDSEKERRIERLLTLAGTGLAAERVVHEFGRQVAAAHEGLAQLRKLVPGGSRSLEAVKVLETCLDTLKSEFRILAPYEAVDRSHKQAAVSLRDAAELALTINKRLIEASAIQAVIGGEDFEVHTRHAWIVQVLDNLVNNACYWLGSMPPEGARLLRIVLDRDRRQVLVVDNGPGVHEEAKDHLFEPFFSMKGGGTGLGLYISKEVMQRVPGTIRLLTDADPRLDERFANGGRFLLDFQKSPTRKT